jgi:hypothetical protein
MEGWVLLAGSDPLPICATMHDQRTDAEPVSSPAETPASTPVMPVPPLAGQPVAPLWEGHKVRMATAATPGQMISFS